MVEGEERVIRIRGRPGKTLGGAVTVKVKIYAVAGVRKVKAVAEDVNEDRGFIDTSVAGAGVEIVIITPGGDPPIYSATSAA
ncbi:MAG: hypothetical protein ABW250_04150 [Pyrinomonadaceae bacterium]